MSPRDAPSIGSAAIGCRVLPYRIADGPTNMAIDETLLDAVASDPTSAIVRTYGWSVPTLSLGYFQAMSDAEADPRWLKSPIVRRPSGGGALWHDQEVTYTVVVPAHHALARPSTALYQAVHAAIADRLQVEGMPARRRGAGSASGDSTDGRPFLCFLDRDAEDVVVDQVKLVGSAQRRRAGAVLQHGSLLLAGSETTPELPGLIELKREGLQSNGSDLKTTLDLPRWAALLETILVETIGGARFDQEITILEWERADRLKKEVYEASRWTRRR